MNHTHLVNGEFLRKCSLVFLLFASIFASAKDTRLEQKLSGSAIVVGQSMTLTDPADSGYLASSRGAVELRVEDYIGPFEWYTCEVRLAVSRLDNGDWSAPTEVRLKVENNRLRGVGNFVDLQKYLVDGATGIMIEIVSITCLDPQTNELLGTTPENVSLTISYESTRYFQMDAYTLITPTFTPLSSNELAISWSPIEGAEEYDVFWTWVDNYSEDSLQTVLSTSEVGLTIDDFTRNSSRVQVTDTHYTLPLIYDRGYLVCLIRSVGRAWPNYEFKSYSLYLDAISNPVFVSDWPEGNVYEITSGFEGKKNWQFTASYAENGKKKEVVSFFDGSLRNRQTVTKTNTNNETIVGEVIYDNEGRPAVEVLPVPTGTNRFKYYERFNRILQGESYSYQDFVSPSSCTPIVTPMSNASGASNYYSGQNAITDGPLTGFIPNAEGIPFTQTQYTADNTGRIARKSGVGPTHQLGSGHEMKYYYGIPDKSELDRLFGYSVGNVSHYKKNVVIDPNGQVSVSYLDPKGNVIATALSDENPANLSGLVPDETAPSTPITLDLLGKANPEAMDTVLDNNERTSSGAFGMLDDGLRYSGQKIFTSQSNYTFNYSISNTPLIYSCDGKFNYSYPMVYKLEESVTDACGNSMLSVSQTIGSTIPNSNTSTTLSNSNVRELQPGSYQVTKTLTVDPVTLESFANDYIARGLESGCILPEQYPAAPLDCYETCEQCAAHYTGLTYLNFPPGRVSYQEMMLASDSTYLMADPPLDADAIALIKDRYGREYDLLVATCWMPCDGDPATGPPAPGDGDLVSDTCAISLKALMQDMMPTGQYGVAGIDVDEEDFSFVLGSADTVDEYIGNLKMSVYNEQNQIFRGYPDPLYPDNPDWRHPNFYDADGILGANPTYAARAHYFDENGHIDYTEVKWSDEESTFTPPLKDGYNTPAQLDALPDEIAFKVKDGVYKIEPQYLADVKDFIRIIPDHDTWTQSLVRYHPEFLYMDYIYKTCSMVNTVTLQPNGHQYTFNPDGFDTFLNSVDTYEDAVNKGLLADALTLFNNDPYFNNHHPYDGVSQDPGMIPTVANADQWYNIKRAIMFYALNPNGSYTMQGSTSSGDAYTNSNQGGFEGSDKSLSNYAYHGVKCTGIDGGCVGGSDDFGTLLGYMQTNLTDVERNEWWKRYSAYYQSLKQKIQSSFVNAVAARKGFFGDCIGRSNGGEKTRRIYNIVKKYANQREVIKTWIQDQQIPDHRLKTENGQFVKKFSRRFPPYDAKYDSDSSEDEIFENGLAEGNYQYLSETGNCPIMQDISAFLEGISKEKTANGTPKYMNGTTPLYFNPPYFSETLFKAIGGVLDTTFIMGEPKLGTTVISPYVLKLEVLRTNNPMSPFNLTIPSSASFPADTTAQLGVLNMTWNNYGFSGNTWKITEIRNIGYVSGPVNGIYTFQFAVRVHRNNDPNSYSFKEMLFTGTTGAKLTCSTDPGVAVSEGSIYVPYADNDCHKKEDFEISLANLINALIQSGQVNSTTPVDLINLPAYTEGFLPEYYHLGGVPQVKWLHIPAYDTYEFRAGAVGSSGSYFSMTVDFGTISNDYSIEYLSVGEPDASGGNKIHFKKIYEPTGAETIIDGVIKGEMWANTNSIMDFACCDDGTKRLLELFKIVFNQGLDTYVAAVQGNPVPAPIVTPEVLEFAHNLDINIGGPNFGLWMADANAVNYSYWNAFQTNVPYIFTPTTDVWFAIGDQSPNLCVFGNSWNYADLFTTSIVNGVRVAQVIPVTYEFFNSDNNLPAAAFVMTDGSVFAFKLPNCLFRPQRTCDCQPQPIAPVDCSAAYQQYASLIQSLPNYATANNPMTEEDFCSHNYHYVIAGYSYYLSSFNLTATSFESTNYISLTEFASSAFGYGYPNYNTQIDLFKSYLGGSNLYYKGPDGHFVTANERISGIDYNLVDTWREYAEWVVSRDQICLPRALPSAPVKNLIPSDPCISFTTSVYDAYNHDAYNAYIQKKKDDFKKAYLEKALKAVEQFTVSYPDKEYQYTLYYYDQAGNLIQTVAPEGVSRLNMTTSLSTQIATARAQNITTSTENTSLLPSHRFKTQYRYNSLNQLVWQSTPDGGETRFAYDKLGRIIASQNANQTQEVPELFSLLIGAPTISKTADNVLVKAGNNLWADQHSSSPILPAGVKGYVEFTVRELANNPNASVNLMVGFSINNLSNPTSMRYAFSVTSLTDVKYVLNNVQYAFPTSITLKDGDILRVERSSSNQMRWLVNDVVVHSIADPTPNQPLIVDTAMYTPTSRIENLKAARFDKGNLFAYSKYDNLGRVVESGGMTLASNYFVDDNGRLSDRATNQPVTINPETYPYAFSPTTTEVTKTYYSDYPLNPDAYLTPKPTRNSQNRVTAILTFKENTLSTPVTNHETAILYDYDIHGNVSEMAQHLSADVSYMQMTKKVEYEYDLISGNVNKVTYQKNQTDQFIHRYEYDADNRISSVETSKDGVIWERDAAYKYYDHGPLARVALGDKQVQGIDYAYTLQGWLKVVNSENTANLHSDMGQDGDVVSKDVFGYSLGYFDNDYQPIAPGNITPLSVSPTSPGSADLFNGNIKRMITTLRYASDEKQIPIQSNRYQYDQLNRLIRMEGFRIGDTGEPAPDYTSMYSYDRNGNIKTLQAMAPNNTQSIVAMDNLTYQYQPNKNKLEYVSDAIGAGVFGSTGIDKDIDNQTAGNYTYDAIGQLKSDQAEGITNIEWRLDGKVKKIEKNEWCRPHVLL